MDKIRNAYFYFFYVLYKFGSRSGPFPNDFSAGILIVILEVLILGVLKFYYIWFIDSNDSIKPWSLETIIPLLAIFFINYFAFVNDNKWREYVKKFDNLPKVNNIIGKGLVAIIIAIILINVVISFNMMGEIASRRHK